MTSSLRTQRFYDDDDGLLLDRQNCMSFPSRQYMFKVNKDIRARWEICPKLTRKTPEYY